MPDYAPDTLMFFDAETTGLNPAQHMLLEIGAIAVDPETLDIRESFRAILPFNVNATDLKIDDYVLEMHSKNDLWEDCFEHYHDENSKGPDEIRADLEAFFKRHRGAWLAGRGVDRFDRGFVEHDWPEVFGHLHYRSLDLRACIRLGELVPGLWDGLDLATPDSHRSIDDCLGDIEILRQMKERLGGLVAFADPNPFEVA